jgi:hypothetical protein
MELAASEIDAAIVDVSLRKDNSYSLVEGLIARGLPFALATGYGQDGMEPRYWGAVDAQEAVRFCDVTPYNR